MNELALFAGIGGGILGGKLLGWRTVCAVEIDAYCASILVQRQNDGVLPPFPIWDDVTTFDGRPWSGIVDVVSGGFPCQDISCAGRGDGLDGERSGLWTQFARIISEVQPRYVFVENSPALTRRGGTRVIGDLTEMGYDCRWGVISAADAGANHLRKRIWIVAHSDGGIAGRKDSGRETRPGSGEHHAGDVADADSAGQQERLRAESTQAKLSFLECCRESMEDTGCLPEGRAAECGEAQEGRALSQPAGSGWWESEPDVGRVAHGVSRRVDKLRALGNAQVPSVAALAWRILTQ